MPSFLIFSLVTISNGAYLRGETKLLGRRNDGLPKLGSVLSTLDGSTMVARDFEAYLKSVHDLHTVTVRVFASRRKPPAYCGFGPTDATRDVWHALYSPPTGSLPFTQDFSRESSLFTKPVQRVERARNVNNGFGNWLSGSHSATSSISTDANHVEVEDTLPDLTSLGLYPCRTADCPLPYKSYDVKRRLEEICAFTKDSRTRVMDVIPLDSPPPIGTTFDNFEQDPSSTRGSDNDQSNEELITRNILQSSLRILKSDWSKQIRVVIPVRMGNGDWGAIVLHQSQDAAGWLVAKWAHSNNAAYPMRLLAAIREVVFGDYKIFFVAYETEQSLFESDFSTIGGTLHIGVAVAEFVLGNGQFSRDVAQVSASNHQKNNVQCGSPSFNNYIRSLPSQSQRWKKAIGSRNPKTMLEEIQLALDTGNRIPTDEWQDLHIAFLDAASRTQSVQTLWTAIERAKKAGIKNHSLQHATDVLNSLRGVKVHETDLNRALKALDRASRESDAHTIQQAIDEALSVGVPNEDARVMYARSVVRAIVFKRRLSVQVYQHEALSSIDDSQPQNMIAKKARMQTRIDVDSLLKERPYPTKP